VTYVVQTAWPHALAVFHPHSALVEGDAYAPWRPAVLVGALVVLGLSLAAWRLRGHAGWLFTGWFWFLVGLVPVLGLVQVGEQAWAARYAYLPTIGLYLVLGQGARVALGARARAVLPVAAALLLGIWSVRARAQVHVWEDSHTLFAHAVAVTEKNWVAHNHLGLLRMEAGDLDLALESFEAALAVRPDATRPLYNAALVHLRRSELERATARLEQALATAPGFAPAWATLGIVQGRRGRLENARRSFERALVLDPDDAPTRSNLGALLVALGDDAAAAGHLRRALTLDATLANAAERLAWILATSPSAELRDPVEALRLARQAAAAGHDPATLATLAAAHAANGAFDEAIRWQRSALESAPPPLLPELRERLALYEAGRPHVREPR
jgi:tetratricopeptide (TPR) repeat protein